MEEEITRLQMEMKKIHFHKHFKYLNFNERLDPMLTTLFQLHERLDPMLTTSYQLHEQLDPLLTTSYQLHERLDPMLTTSYQLHERLDPMLTTSHQVLTIFCFVPDDAFKCDGRAWFTGSEAIRVGDDPDVTSVNADVPCLRTIGTR